ncbi:2-hydroxyacid dehydrogenase [Marinomonas sp. SBI22]|uniref:2-hydroxyacid dehydrogenase n=1 Tax=unclassified Marinomonas TaxID=196814 RepID=UPI0007AF9A9A|nr:MULTISPECIES: glyoxylate/hydroxypyruvate reductase A [unclassified Marinomonas]KZM42564.1 2-hydroxyacid dehydrogenase [Marinomonas sp. SBI22]KZM43958.1 2-hydroxyacid dehydrogenase [Marinomonas sp. SBI8L]
MKHIVFLSRLTDEAQFLWLEHLNSQLQNQTVLLPDQIPEGEEALVDIAIVSNPNPEDLLRYPNLVLVQSLWAGVEGLVQALKSDVFNKAGFNKTSLDKESFNKASFQLIRLVDPTLAQSMAESVLAWTLYLQRNMPSYAKQQGQKQWRKLQHRDSKDLRISMLGAGKLGLASLSLLQQLNYSLSCWTRSPKVLDGIRHYHGRDGLKAMMEQTDILINLLPLTPNTHHMLNNETLAWLPKGAKLINFSRGAVVNTADLLACLDSGQIEHAVLDVFEQEPLPVESEVWSHPKITVLPHISAPTNKETAAKIVADNIHLYRTENKLLESVDIKLGY